MSNVEQDKKRRIQWLIDRIARDSQEAHSLAVEVFGQEAMVFAEGDGSLQVMSGDCDGSAIKRQQFVKLTAEQNHGLAVGAW